MGARRLAFAAAVAFVAACSSPAATPTPTISGPSTTLAAVSSGPPATPPPTPTASPASTPSPSPSLTESLPPTPVLSAAAAIPQVRLVRAMGGLSFSSMTGAFQNADGRWYVVEQSGRILTFREGDASATVFLDIRDHVESGGEKGLLGFAFAPDFAQTGVFFVDYTRGGPLRTEIASFTSSGTVANKASEVVLLEIAQPFDNHNGGQLAFGPDGYLYIGMGDGGSGGDPMRNGQNKNVLLAKLLRITSAIGRRTGSRPTTRSPEAGAAARSGRTGCATRGASRSTPRPACSGSPTWARTGGRRSTSSRAARTSAGTPWRRRIATTPPPAPRPD